MATKPVSIDHVNIFVRDAERSHKWYTDVFGFHTQDTFNFPGTEKVRAVFLACDPGHAHDIALFAVGEDAALQQKGQVGLNHVAWRMASLDDLAEMYHRLKAQGVPFSVSDHTISIGIFIERIGAEDVDFVAIDQCIAVRVAVSRIGSQGPILAVG